MKWLSSKASEQYCVPYCYEDRTKILWIFRGLAKNYVSRSCFLRPKQVCRHKSAPSKGSSCDWLIPLTGSFPSLIIKLIVMIIIIHYIVAEPRSKRTSKGICISPIPVSKTTPENQSAKLQKCSSSLRISHA